MGNEEDKLEVLQCTQCGGNLSKSYRIEEDDDDEVESIPIAKCLSCSTEYDQKTDEYYKFFADDFLEGKDNSVFKLGIKGTLEGVEYEIIGRIRYQDEEDYEIETWDEWLAVDAEGSYHYFVEEDGDIHSYEEYTPNSIDLESDPDYIEFDGKRISKDDGYVGRVVYFEGEFPYNPEMGEAVNIYDFKKDGDKYTIEQGEDEVSITKGDEISHKEIIDAFGTDEHKELYDSTMKKRKDFSRKSWLYLAATIVTFILAVGNCSVDKPVKNVMVKGKYITKNEKKYEKGRSFYFSQVMYGPFKIEKKNQLYGVTLYVNTRVQRFNLEWQSVRAMLIKKERLNKALKKQKSIRTGANTNTGTSTGVNTNAWGDGQSTSNRSYVSNTSYAMRNLLKNIDSKKNPVESYIVTADFWDEQGYDDGYWHESDTKNTVDFVLDEAGDYYLYIESYSQKPRNMASVKVKISETSSARYYIIVMFIFMILFFLNRSKSKSYNELPFDMA